MVSSREKAVIKGDRALGRLGGEMAAGEGDDSSPGLSAALEQVSEEEMLRVSALQAELRGEDVFAKGHLHSVMECMCCAKCPQIPVAVQPSVTTN